MNMKIESMGSLKENVASEFNEKHSSARAVVTAALTLWLGLVSVLGFKAAFVGSAGSPPVAIFLGVAIPSGVFFATYFGWSAFRTFVLSADLRFVSAVQAWRWGGIGFLALYAHGVLPGLFAFPAGLGDMAIGVTAPWIVLSLIRQPSFAGSRRYRIWNILGILDLVVAVSMGTLCSGFVHGLTLNVTTGAMAQLPLVLIPAYMVPLFIMLHFTALAQARHLAHSGKPHSYTKDLNQPGRT